MKINGYSNQSCTYGNQNRHREWPVWEWMRTWATNEPCAIIKMGSMYNKEHETYHMHHQTTIKTIQGKIGILEFWNYLKIRFLEIKCKNENFRN